MENLTETPPPPIPSRGIQEIASGTLPGGVISRRTLRRHGRLRSDVFHVGAGITGVAPHYIPPPSTFNVLLGSSWHMGKTCRLRLHHPRRSMCRRLLLPRSPMRLACAYYLDGYVDGTIPCPPSMVHVLAPDGTPMALPNPAHRQWTAQDQAILSAIQSSLMPTVAGMVLFAATSHQAWSTLDASFSSQSMARSMAIRNKLGDLKKLDKSVTAYYNEAKELADILSSIGQPLRDSEFIGYILKGLGEDYDSLVENVEGRDSTNPISAHDMYAHLLNTEQCLGARRPDGPSFDAPVNAAYRGGRNQQQPRPFSGSPPQPPKQPASQPRPATTTGGRGRSWVCTTCGTKAPCQLCGIAGHLASRCHRRFKQDFLGIGNDGSGNEKQAALATHTHGSTTTYPVDATWYMDTGASDHLTHELSRLNPRETYAGHDQVRTADGTGMRISHVGQASLLSHTSRHVHLRNVLRVPSVTRNLLSVKRLTIDNDVFVEFHPFHFFVKDRVTRDVLLRGRSRDGLYVLDAPAAPAASTAPQKRPKNQSAQKNPEKSHKFYSAKRLTEQKGQARGGRGLLPISQRGQEGAAPPYGVGPSGLHRHRLFAYIVSRDVKTLHQLTKLQKDSRGAAVAKLRFGGQSLSGTPPGRGIAPGVISIDTTAIFTAVAVSHDEEGVVLPRG
ncbi:hypothetical protein QYE76_008939 [Lolium multiflorum]|uniref:Retrovirus-related Pol polyprotein from transposon TNT 1-94-like beta-barrel domain-containing protein n=1 Tax=Lolium multiflorum TaxID=4521 RepID=A0AAD8TSP0_LOLMU|nr:hypothetical protein QYE76_008939 [Lolium multiflorum]